MSFLAFLIGVLSVTATGWLVTGAVQGRAIVLNIYERLAWGAVAGTTASMFIVFLSHILGLTAFTLTGFALPLLSLAVVCGFFSWRNGTLLRTAELITLPERPYPRWVKVGVAVLIGWTILKILAGAYNLTTVPTYWDDSFNNWNMRGKMFFIEEKLVLEIPTGNGVVQTAQGVSSYPPTVSMMKTWLAVLRGEWSDGLVNSVHAVWFIALLVTVCFTLRRFTDRTTARLGVYLTASLPLVLIHGSNPYADIFVAAHVLLAVSAMLGLSRAADNAESSAWTRLFFLAIGLLAFTKNEALLLHVPLLLMAGIWIAREMNLNKRSIITGIALAAAVVLPWMLFKWANGLTFGNAKSVLGSTFAFNPHVPGAIWFHFTHEPNWLFLPAALLLAFLWRGRDAWRLPSGALAAFVLLSVVGQMALFTFIPSLATEAIMQTGLSRGLLHIAPVTVILLVLLLQNNNRLGSADMVK